MILATFQNHGYWYFEGPEQGYQHDTPNHQTVISHFLDFRYNRGSSCFFFRCLVTLSHWFDWHGMKNYTETELSSLMQAAIQGDMGKYEDFLKKAVRPIENQIARILPFGITDDKDDLVQEVLFAIHQKRQTWRSNQPILPWINAITKYRAIDHLRRLNRQKTTSLDHHADQLIADSPDPIRRLDLVNMVHRLNGKTRWVLQAIGLEGNDITGTARALNMSENAVRIAFHRGLKKLTSLHQTKQIQTKQNQTGQNQTNQNQTGQNQNGHTPNRYTPKRYKGNGHDTTE